MGDKDKDCEYHQEIREELEEHRGDVQDQLREMRRQQQEVLDKMDEVLVAVGKMDGVLTAWNNAEGFVNTVQWISKVVKFLTPIGLVLFAVYYFVTHGGQLPPTE